MRLRAASTPPEPTPHCDQYGRTAPRRWPGQAGPRRHNIRVSIERISDLAAGQVAALVAESEAQGLRFVRRLAEDWASGANRFDRPGEALFVARADGRVVGIGGLNVDPYAAEPTVGRVRHLYVLTAYRRLGIGRRIVEEIIEAARGRFERLRLSTSNPEAARLYERLGFHPRADVAHCTHAMEKRAQPERTAT